MPRIAKGQPSRRLNLEMTETVRNNLDQLRDETNADTYAEVVRRALALYDFAWKSHQRGAKLQVENPDGTVQNVLVLF
jgi:hypothetical protein